MKSNGEFKIETGIPIPPPQTGGGRYPWRKMKVGDSFLVPGKTQKTWNGVSAAHKMTGFKFTVRTVEGGVRVWRIA